MAAPIIAHWLADQDGWPQPILKTPSDVLNISSTETNVIVKAVLEPVYPDAILAQTGFTGSVTDIDENPDSPDGAWVIGTTGSEIRVSFPSPSADLMTEFTQQFRIRMRSPA